MRSLRVFLATVTCHLVLVVTTTFCAVLTVLTFWVPPRGNVMRFLTRPWSWLWLKVSGVPLAVHLSQDLRDRVARGESFIYLANHTSWFDIPVLLLTVPGQVRMLAKRSLFKMPVLGWALWGGGFIPVDREDRKRASGAFAQAVERLESGCSVLVFAEGTRSLDGKLAPFKRGGFVLALKSGKPIVPVGVRGTFEVMPRTTLWVRPGKASVHYGEPVDVEAFGLRGRKELMETVRERVAELAGQDPSPG